MTEYYTQSELISLGWSKSMITKLLGVPDSHDEVKVYGAGKVRRNLFLKERVDQKEETNEFKILLEKKEKRSKNTNTEKIIQTKITNQEKNFQRIKDTILNRLKHDHTTYEKLVQIARGDINLLAMERNREGMALVSDERNVSNYLRHWIYELANFPKTTRYYDRYRMTIDNLVSEIISEIQGEKS